MFIALFHLFHVICSVRQYNDLNNLKQATQFPNNQDEAVFMVAA